MNEDKKFAKYCLAQAKSNRAKAKAAMNKTDKYWLEQNASVQRSIGYLRACDDFERIIKTYLEEISDD